MTDDQKTKTKTKTRRNVNRPSISVSGKTYDRLRAAYPTGSLAALVDKWILTALDDPATAARMAALSQQTDVLS